MSKETPKKELEEVILTTEEEIEKLKQQIKDLKTEKSYISEAYNTELAEKRNIETEKRNIEDNYKKKLQAKDLELNELRKRISQEHNVKEDISSLNEQLKRTQEGERIRISQLQKMMKLTGGLLNSLQSQIENLTELYNYQVEDIQNTYKN